MIQGGDFTNGDGMDIYLLLDSCGTDTDLRS